MKRQTTLALAMLVPLAIFAAPKFITPSMMHRNGLTDEQYEFLWSIGRNPTVDTATARDWAFRASRYHNVTNWLGMIGKTNDFAKAVQTLGDQVYGLTATNKTLAASNTRLEKSIEAWDRQFRKLDVEMLTLSEKFKATLDELAAERAKSTNILERLNSAEARVERVTAALDEKRAEYVEKRDKSSLPTTKAIYQAFIDAIDRIRERLKIEGGDN